MFTRLVAGAALCAAVIVCAVALVGGSSYRLTASFQNASQLVKGNEVQASGIPIGLVKSIELTPEGSAAVVIEIDDDRYVPLREGTQAIIRQTSLAGVANRYVDLRLPAGEPPAIPDGGTIDSAATTSAVEIDQLFNTFDPETRRSVSDLMRGAADQWRGKSREARLGMLHLNPALAATNRLVEELNASDAELGRFLKAGSALASDVASERDAVEGAVEGLATTAEALAADRDGLGDAIERLPAFLRRANTTFVNLRATFDDLDPLVADARPLARDLVPLSRDLRGLARDGRPAARDLAAIANRAGGDNDLADLIARLPAVRDRSTRPRQAGGRDRDPLFDAASKALEGFAPEFAFIRPYMADATGWFDDFAHTGVYDALGGTGRIAFHGAGYANVAGTLTYVPPELRESVFQATATRDHRDRCPGALERNTAYKPTPDFNCDMTQVPLGR